MTEIKVQDVKLDEIPVAVTTKLATAEFQILGPTSKLNPWSPSDIDKMESVDSITEYRKTVEACRFFYRRDPIASTVINKLVDIGINDIEYKKEKISSNEYRVFEALEDKLLEFAESMALEFLLSGLVIPEINYRRYNTDELRDLGIKRYSSLILPDSMWIRDPNTIVINQTILNDRPSFYVEIPADLIYFITNGGRYQDGTTDEKLYLELLAYYPDFVKMVLDGEKLIKIENNYVVRRRATTDSPYPISYLYSAIEPLKHKRNLRRMDYAIASRVIGAIQLIRLGSDEFPVTEDDKKVFDNLREQMMWRNSNGRDVERIFQLYGNHTLQIDWIMPDIEALINDAKYKDINQDIIFALGFPRILMTGETERSNTSDAQFASMSPVKTMDSFRRKIRVVLQKMINDVAKFNNFSNTPEVEFKPLQLTDFKVFVDAVANLYSTGNLSRESFAELFGYSWEDEMEKKVEEQKVLEDSGLPEFAPAQFSEQPGTPGQPAGATPPKKPNNNKAVSPKSTQK